MSIYRLNNLSVVVLSKPWTSTEKLVNGWRGCHSIVFVCLCCVIFIFLKVISRFLIKIRFVITLLVPVPGNEKNLKAQSCRLCNKYMIASTQITSAEVFAFIAVLVFKLSSRKLFFVNKRQYKLLKIWHFFRK